MGTDLDLFSGVPDLGADIEEDLVSDGFETESSLPDEVVAERSWSAYTMCKEEWNAPDHLTRHDAFVHTSRNGDHDALTFNLKLPLSAGGYPTTVAMVSLDVRTGRELSCVPLPIPNAISSDLTRFDSTRRVAFYGYSHTC